MHNYNVPSVDYNVQLLHYSWKLTDYILLLCSKIYSSVYLKSPFNKTLQFVDSWLFPLTMTEAINETKRKSSVR